MQGAHTPFATVQWNQNTKYMLLYNLFGGLWVSAFLLGWLYFVVASTCCIWYFS